MELSRMVGKRCEGGYNGSKMAKSWCVIGGNVQRGAGEEEEVVIQQHTHRKERVSIVLVNDSDGIQADLMGTHAVCIIMLHEE